MNNIEGGGKREGGGGVGVVVTMFIQHDISFRSSEEFESIKSQNHIDMHQHKNCNIGFV